MEELDDDALRDILTTPKNALLKQYQKMFSIDGVELEFDQDAINAIVDLAQARGTGARGLRSILENVLTPIMFDLPSRDDIAVVTITGEVVTAGADPLLLTRAEAKKLSRKSA